MQTKLLRLTDVLNHIGLSSSSLYNRINDGTFPAPISLGARAVAWPEHEVQAIVSALIQERPKAEIAELVKSLIKQRKEA